jgi:hypothetical protein
MIFFCMAMQTQTKLSQDMEVWKAANSEVLQ